MARAKKAESPKAQNFEYLIAYVLGFVSGILMYLYRKDDKNMRFHAVQASIIGIIMAVLFFLTIIGVTLSFLLWLYSLYIGFNASEGRKIVVPIIGEYAERMSA